MLHFANPAALWLLLLIPPLIALYLLKRKRQEVVVPCTVLWKQVLEDVQVQTPFQKLRSNLLLLLQILIIVLVSAVLAEPQILHPQTGQNRWVLVLDTSASMQARDENPDRFTLAKKKLLEFLHDLPDTDEAMLVTTSQETAILQTFTMNHERIESKIREVTSEDLTSHWNQLRQVLQSLVRENPDLRIVIASDFASFPANFPEEIPFQTIAVGNSDDNVAITRIGIQPQETAFYRQIVFYQILNAGRTTKNVEVELKAKGHLLDAYDLSLAAGEATDRTIGMEVSSETLLEIRLNVQDFLPLDNQAFIPIHPREKLKIHLQTDDPFLERAIAVLPGVVADPTGPIRVGTVENPDSAPGLYFLDQQNTVKNGAVVQWNVAHPTLRFMQPHLWKFYQCRILELPPSGLTLIEAEEGTVAYAEEYNGKRRIVAGFRPADSNLVLLGSFPIFLQNVLSWIAEPLYPSLLQNTSLLHKKEGPVEIQGKRGFVNFADPMESVILPRQPAGKQSAGIQRPIIKKDASNILLLLLLGAVILEWWVFHRKIE